MDREQLKQIIDSADDYDEDREESYDAYAKRWLKMTEPWMIVLVFGHFFVCVALGVVCGIFFAYTPSTKYQIMWAAIFVCVIIIGYLIKVFGWIMASRNDLKRDIKRLELRFAEVLEVMQNES